MVGKTVAKPDGPRSHIVIPDCQVKPGVNTRHLHWIGAYIRERSPDTVVCLGDFWDMPSLSSYDRGKRASWNRYYDDDIQAGNDAFAILEDGIGPGPERHFLRGNHEHRLSRALEDEGKWVGTASYDDMDTRGWAVSDFLEPLWIDGVCYSHYFVNKANGRPLGGMIQTRLKTLGHTFVQGHQQGLQTGMHQTLRGLLRGVVAGSCYLHAEEYRGPQCDNPAGGVSERRGILVLHEVQDGEFDIMEVSLNYLCRRFEKMPVRTFIGRYCQ